MTITRIIKNSRGGILLSRVQEIPGHVLNVEGYETEGEERDCLFGFLPGADTLDSS